MNNSLGNNVTITITKKDTEYRPMNYTAEIIEPSQMAYSAGSLSGNGVQ